MGKPHSIELRARVVAFEATRHFRVSPRFVNNMMILHRSTGSLVPARQGHPPGSKLAAHGVWISERVSGHGEVTLDELCRELAGRGVDVHRATVARVLHGLGFSNKKSLRASEQRRPEIAKARELWTDRRTRFFNKALARLVFIDETSTNTKLRSCPWRWCSRVAAVTLVFPVGSGC
jgi:transposase